MQFWERTTANILFIYVFFSPPKIMGEKNSESQEFLQKNREDDKEI